MANKSLVKWLVVSGDQCYDLTYKVCPGLRMTKRDEWFWATFNHFWIEFHFWGSWGNNKNKLEPKTKPLDTI